MRNHIGIHTLLIANRGEIAIRIARAAAELGIRSVAIFSEDDEPSLHVRKTNEARGLRGIGPAAYLDMEQILEAALATKCDAIHPGYGFLSENAQFARRCVQAGLIFIGPRPELLDLFGDKTQARALAERSGVAVLPGTEGATTLDQAYAFFARLPPGATVMIKAVRGGGGRGMRIATTAGELEPAYTRCRSEAQAALGNGDVYLERYLPKARHIEIQIIGDGRAVTHLGERECSVQRQHQKIVEVAPSFGLPQHLREELAECAVLLARETRFDNVGTFEFLVTSSDVEGDEFLFLEVNPRLQVEHTVTEELTGVDLVKTQIQLASGCSLPELELEQESVQFRRGFAMELRVNTETLDDHARAVPSAGTLTTFEPPLGPGIRVDTCGYPGYRTNPGFDSLLAKLIGYSPSPRFADLIARMQCALAEFQIEGVATNIPFLKKLLEHPEFRAAQIYTRFVEDHLTELLPAALVEKPSRAPANIPSNIEGATAVTAPMQGLIVSVDVAEGELVHQGQQVAVLEAMKMQHVVDLKAPGIVRKVTVKAGDLVLEGNPLVWIESSDAAAVAPAQPISIDLDHIRADLSEVLNRHAIGLDAQRPESVERRRKKGQRTARENVDDLCDPGSFTEYGALAIAAQRSRRSLDDLIQNTPADGLISGVGSVNGALFSETASRCMVLAYDYTVLAGTQGALNHKKTDHMLRQAEQLRLPVVLFAEGGGGRPGDTDGLAGAHLDVITFRNFAKLSGLVPLVGIVSGRCFAGNASLLGCCDVIIATKNVSIGMAGPAMIEGGGLGVYHPDEVGPIGVHRTNGVVDIAVEDEAAAVAVTKKYLSYFQGRVTDWNAADQRLLRSVIPEDRLRVYPVRRVIEILADTQSWLELRQDWGVGMITGFLRVEGRPLGLIANNPMHLAGAIDPDGADKASRFMQLCDAYGLPILSLCDTPGFMVGPEIEKRAQVRHTSRMFLTGANLNAPYLVVILRKAYGLGAQAMAGGCFSTPLLNVSWPTGELGPMGLEGAVKLAFRKELDAIEDPQERRRAFERMVAQSYENGKALNVASFLEFDDVIDPLETRTRIVRALKSLPMPTPILGKRRPFIDAW